jgi:predicted ATPase
MIFYGDGSNNEYWDDLLELMQKPSNENNNIANLINTEIIKGQVTADDSIYATEGYKFLRNDGQIFNLLDVATGIKSFSILQLLLKNGSINEKTLMIIDEPESHLHPQWIIEYARIVVLLNKHLGVKFFLATHNPDMVSAIRYISEKEGTLEKVNFYLAEQSDEKFKYNYKSLNTDIEPIFASFNIALERINQYGI